MDSVDDAIDRAWMGIGVDDAGILAATVSVLSNTSAHLSCYLLANCHLRQSDESAVEFGELPHRGWSDAELCRALLMSARLLRQTTSARQERLLHAIHESLIETTAERLEARYVAQTT